MEEIWIGVRNYIGLYQVSNYGRVKSVERDVIDYVNGKQRVRHFKEKILTPQLSGCGYLIVNLSKNGKQEFKRVNVLVAEAFIPNLNNYTDVHHKNHDERDNRIENLEWISKDKHHALHGAEQAKTVYQYTFDGLLVNVWESGQEVERILGFKRSAISACCIGKRKRAYGYIWSYSPINA